jgi:hypothetical protein
MINNGTGYNNIKIGRNLILVALGTAVLAPIEYEAYSVNTPTSIFSYHQLPTNSWENTLELTDNSENLKFNSLKAFSENLISNAKDIDPEILEVVNKNFWDLL